MWDIRAHAAGASGPGWPIALRGLFAGIVFAVKNVFVAGCGDDWLTGPNERIKPRFRDLMDGQVQPRSRARAPGTGGAARGPSRSGGQSRLAAAGAPWRAGAASSIAVMIITRIGIGQGKQRPQCQIPA